MKLTAHAAYHPQPGFLPWWGWAVDDSTGKTVGEGDGETAAAAMEDALQDACAELGMELVPDERDGAK